MSTPSKYQKAIYGWVRDGRGDAVVSAVAGSGKTTTLVEASRLLHTDSALFLAFNKSIVEELQSRLGHGVTAKTLNALGHGAVVKAFGRGRRIRLDNNKYGDIIADELKQTDVPAFAFGDALRALRGLVSFVQSTLTDPNDDAAVFAVAGHYGIELPTFLSDSTVLTILRNALTIGEAQGRKGIVSFDDQIWLPAKLGLKPVTADFVLVDEAQDLSAAKLELALAARAKGGRILFVGDPAQAIYGFAGADCDSFANIIKRTNATVLPLSVCYRCPVSVIDAAKEIVPQIEAAPNAQPGTVSTIKHADVATTVRNGDLILCRLTAPLVKLCIELIGQRVPARVKGRDIGSQLVKIASDALGHRSFTEIEYCLTEYLSARTAALLNRKNSESQIVALHDKVDGVRACLDAFKCESLADFSREVQALFSDGTSVVELSTIHRAKGLEADRVFIIEPKKLPLVWKGQKAWEAEQERNLKYVALTRARQDLFIVGSFASAAAPVTIPVPTTHDDFVTKTLPALVSTWVEPVATRTPVATVVEEPALRFSAQCYRCDARFVTDHRERVCRACNERSVQLKVINGKYSDTPCDARCTNATGHDCVCSCGGANHGAKWLVGYEQKIAA